jgi:hypothetical protein
MRLNRKKIVLLQFHFKIKTACQALTDTFGFWRLPLVSY